jgi:hypothetical protein
LSRIKPVAAALAVLAILAVTLPAAASSHREAPFVTEHPKVDATDFYMFRSYEPGREDYVTLIANYLPLQDPYGGPNYFTLDQEAEYVIHVDNTGDGVEDVSFVFLFDTFLRGIALPVGGQMVPIPLIQAGVLDSFAKVNRNENFQVLKVEGELGGVDRSGGTAVAADEATVTAASHLSMARPLNNPGIDAPFFGKPLDNVGPKTFPSYAAYANLHVFDAEIPGCGDGRVFVGQRKDPFVVALGEVFDLINLDPVGARDAQPDDLADKNVTTLALEVPIACLTGGGSGTTIGGWTAARLPRNRTLSVTPSFDQPAMVGGGWVQVSRLGMPLVNEVVIGLPDKNLFNAARPDGDAALATYVTNPTLPELIELLFGGAGVQAPNNFPRLDLVAAFATGIDGLNFLSDGAPHEMLRLNTAIPVTPKAAQSDLGVLGGDNAGFPNGRRPGDDVVDIELRVAMGVLCHAFPGAFGCGPADAPSGTLPYTDGALVTAERFPAAFPYLETPLPGTAD